MNLFDVTRGLPVLCNDKPRSATLEEQRAYLCGLARRRGFDPGEHFEINGNGYDAPRCIIIGECFAPELRDYKAGTTTPPLYAEGSVCIPTPGYGRQPVVTMDILDDAGEIVRTIPLPADKRGKLPITAAQLKEYSGLKSVRGKRQVAQPASIVEQSAPSEAIAPVPQPITPAGDIAAILARLEALERAMASSPTVAIAAPVNDNTQPRERTALERRAVVRAWRMRRELRDARDRRRSIDAVHRGMDAHIDRLEQRVRRVEEERNAAIERAEALARKRLAVHEILQRMRHRTRSMHQAAESAQQEARAAVSAMAVLTERWSALQARREETAQPWMPQARQPLQLVGHA